MLAIIGGSGLESLPGLEVDTTHRIITPYGRSSSPVLQGLWCGVKVLFLSRHNEDHSIAPHLINYRANIWALKELGASHVIAVAAVGGITELNAPRMVNIPDQIIDYTWGRQHTFVEEGGRLQHINFCHPYNQEIRQSLLNAVQEAGVEEQVVDGGCYGATQGPRLETAAEIQRLKRDGCDIVGMTGMPEAALAMETELKYACIALIVNWGAGVLEEEISLEEIYENLRQGMKTIERVLQAYLQSL